MISDNLQCIFMHIPKTGGSSVSYFLKGVSRENIEIARSRLGAGKGVSVNDSNGNNVKHIALHRLIKEEPKLGNYFKFTIVRNPYDRTMSYYFWYKGTKKMKNGFDKTDFKRFVKQLQDFQTGYITDPETGEIIVDKIVKYESLIPGLSSIPCLKKFNFTQLPQLNVSQNNRKNFYDAELKDIVYTKFKKDFEILGYPK